MVRRVEFQRGRFGTFLLPIVEGCPFLTVWNRCVSTCEHRVQFFLLRLNIVDALVVVGHCSSLPPCSDDHCCFCVCMSRVVMYVL